LADFALSFAVGILLGYVVWHVLGFVAGLFLPDIDPDAIMRMFP
jgi:hypothetical protein